MGRLEGDSILDFDLFGVEGGKSGELAAGAESKVGKQIVVTNAASRQQMAYNA
jgi:hypothetical protein